MVCPYSHAHLKPSLHFLPTPFSFSMLKPHWFLLPSLKYQAFSSLLSSVSGPCLAGSLSYNLLPPDILAKVAVQSLLNNAL